jgi:predicted O-linked N-acetylglucosamine transferase (SPINDLY family)
MVASLEAHPAAKPPSLEDGLHSVGEAANAGELLQAERLCRELMRAHPANAKVFHLLGEIDLLAGLPGLAAALLGKAVHLDPANAHHYLTLGDALRIQGKQVEAERALRRGLELAPESPDILIALGAMLHDQGHLSAALESLNHAIDLAPLDGAAYHTCGIVLLSMGCAVEAITCFREAERLSSVKADKAAGILFAQHYLPTLDRTAMYEAARAWGARYADPQGEHSLPHTNRSDPDRRLRVGYLSADFHEHPVGRILQGLLPAHDSSAIEVFCYSNNWRQDAITTELRAAADAWRDVFHINNKALAELIREDQIDILVDLAGHTGLNRTMVLARKPAPVQAIWLGYFDTIGAKAVDYILADSVVSPPGEEQFYVERVMRLPASFLWCPPTTSAVVAPPPALNVGHVTFGSFNNAAKITPEVISLWSEILGAIPDATLCLKYPAYDEAVVRARYLQLFADYGVAPERITFLGRSPIAEHLAVYDEIDVALDPFPYNGGMTTLDALGKGVPVVTLRGERFVGRMGASVLSAMNTPELIAATPQEYVRIAVQLAQNVPALAVLRSTLRQRLSDSPLCDASAFVRGLEASYREMWHDWCRTAGAA